MVRPVVRKYQVLRLVTRLNVGGPARQALLLSRDLSAEFPTLLAAGRPASSEGELSDPAVPVHPVPLTRAVRPVEDLRALVTVRRFLAAGNTRLLHTHMAKAGAVGRLAALSLVHRPRTVHTFHGHVLAGYFSAPQGRAFLEMERWLARRTDVLIAVSPEVRDSLLELGVGRRGQFQVIPLGLDLEPFLQVTGPSGRLRGHLGLAPDVPLVGVVGRLVPIKDHSTLLFSIAQLPGVHLAVLGDGALRRNLEELSRHLGIAARVHFTGWWDDVPAAAGDLDVVALTSRNEGTPVALIEALAAGRPAVATDVGGVRHVIRDGVTGRLCPPGDPEALAGVLGQALADRSAAAGMGAAGRRHAASTFGHKQLLDGMTGLYRELLRESPRQPPAEPGHHPVRSERTLENLR